MKSLDDILLNMTGYSIDWNFRSCSTELAVGYVYDGWLPDKDEKEVKWGRLVERDIPNHSKYVKLCFVV